MLSDCDCGVLQVVRSVILVTCLASKVPSREFSLRPRSALYEVYPYSHRYCILLTLSSRSEMPHALN